MRDKQLTREIARNQRELNKTKMALMSAKTMEKKVVKLEAAVFLLSRIVDDLAELQASAPRFASPELQAELIEIASWTRGKKNSS